MAAVAPLIRDVCVSEIAELDLIAELDRSCSPVLRSASRYRRLVEDGGHLLVAADRGVLQGFAAMATVLDETTLLNIVVAPATRRRGCGRQLLSAALAQATREGARRVILEARESNTAALRLYRSLGFVRDGVRRNYYPARGEQSAESAVLMSLQLENKRASPGDG